MAEQGDHQDQHAPDRTPQAAELLRSDSHPEAAWWRGALIGAAALALALGLLAAVWLLARPLALLVAAIAIAEALAPVVDRLQRRMPRSAAVALVYAVVVVVAAGILWLTVPRLVDQAELLAQNTPDLVQRMQTTVDEWDPSGDGRISDALERNVDRFSGALIGLPLEIASSAVKIVLVLFMSIYWLISAPALGRFTRSLFPEEMVPHVDEVLGQLRASVGGFVRGEGIAALLVGAISYIGLTIIGVDYALVLALLVTVGELVPIIGPIFASIPAIAIGFIDSPTQGVIVIIFYAVLQQLESNVILPQVMDRTAHVPPLIALFAIFAGGTIGGLLGAFVAIPIAAAIKVLVVMVAAPAQRDWSGRRAFATRQATSAGPR
jgi:predicted PurR-regulated permease PerM